MLSYGLILLIQIACLIHAGRTGRPYFWFMIILFVPGLGILAYLAVEVIPGLPIWALAGRILDVPPFATPALCHASACAASFMTKPIVPPLAWQAGLPSMGLVTMKRLPLCE